MYNVMILSKFLPAFCSRYLSLALAALFFLTLSHAKEPVDAVPKPLIPMPEGKFLPGGPMAGYVLPKSPQNTGDGPEVELFPGSVEHWRGYMMKYVPMRSFFDVQSLLKRWIAAEQPGVPKNLIEQYASPVYDQPENGQATDTGKKLPAVPVVRCEPGKPVFSLDLGELEPGLYAVRVIGAVPKDKLRRFRSPVFLRMKINDGPDGAESTYRISTGYVDEFYNVGTFYFHALTKQSFKAELSVDEGSEVPLLVHDISLDDVLAGTVRRAIKTRSILPENPVPTGEAGEGAAEVDPAAAPEKPKRIVTLPPFNPEERLARDESIWNWLPPLNTPAAWVAAKWEPAEQGVADKTAEQIAAEFGVWEAAGGREVTNFNAQTGFTTDPKMQNAFLVNTKLGLAYTMDDLRARKPLPDPFPYKDTGNGLFFPDKANPDKGRVFTPIASGVGRRYVALPGGSAASVKLWKESGNADFARDAAIGLARFAFQYPTIEGGNFLDVLTSNPQYQGRDYTCRQREAYAFWLGYSTYMRVIQAYDELFDYIKGNEELAKSIGRFVPWVKTSEDVIKLFDVYLVQTMAKRILRYHYISDMTAITEMATVLGDPTVTDPWMEWQFSRMFVYPYRLAGLPDLLVTSMDREGPKRIGSTFYSQGDGAGFMIEASNRYIRNGGNPKYDLSDPILYPKPLAHAWWQINTIIGGHDFARIGDVNGPDKTPGFTMREALEHQARQGWKISGDPRFAWILVHLFQRDNESADEWKKIQAAAATVKRAPWLDLPTRHVENWFTVLEAGLDHDDPRFRRAAYLRTGTGQGHAHNDALDLQIVALGVPMTIDGGQRSGYSKPNDRFARIHNLVEVNAGRENGERQGRESYGWPLALNTTPGAAYTRATIKTPPTGAKRYERQIALIDVDEGTGSEPVPASEQVADPKLKPGVTPGNSYVVDFFRVSGGDLHTYGFHGPINDDFQWNATGVQPVAHVHPKDGTGDDDASYLSVFEAGPEVKAAGEAPETFEATWRYLRDEPSVKKPRIGSENLMLGKSFDPQAPRKFTRLTLFDAQGVHALKADVVCHKEQIPYRFTQAMLQRRAGEDKKGELESLFTAVIEPYAGEPFLTSKRALVIPENEADALRAAAVEVETKNGHRDVIFSDGRPYKMRSFGTGVGNLEVTAEYAFYSTDADGLRLATLTGGTLLQGDTLKLSLPAREIKANIVKVDYAGKSFVTDLPLPPAASGGIISILPPGHPAAFTIQSIKAEGVGSRVTLTRSADYYRSEIIKLVENPPTVIGALNMLPALQDSKGRTLSNNDASKTWRVIENANSVFTPDGPVTKKDFEPSNRVRLWEYGIGDAVGIASTATVRRIEKNTFELTANSAVTVSLRGSALETSTDGQSWKPVSTPAPADGWVSASFEAGQFAKPILLRVR